MGEVRCVAGATGAARVEFQVVPAELLPPGKSCRLKETAGHLAASVRPGHASRALCHELTWLHQALTDQGRWVQTPMGDCPNRIEQPAKGLGIVRVRWERVAARILPGTALVAPVERDGFLTWLLHEEHASEQLCVEMTGHAERIAGDGLWQQRWPV